VHQTVGGTRIGERVEGRQRRLNEARHHRKRPTPQWRLTVDVSRANASRPHHADGRRQAGSRGSPSRRVTTLRLTPKGAHR
jgi:hypothetical protein